MAKIFLTGASGYIGGDALHLLVQEHPEYQISVLVRDATKAAQIGAALPNIRVVLGDLDDDDIVGRETAEADVVLQLAANWHLQSARTIHRVLTDPKRDTPAYWIQVSGASALAADEVADPDFVPGSASETVFDDVDGLEAFRAVIRRNAARAMDNYVLDAATTTPTALFHTALVYPPIIYGVGRGVVNQRSVQVPELARLTLVRQRGLQVGAGLSRWGNVHIHDLSALFVRLVEAAVARSTEALWNLDGLYFTSVGELTFGNISKRIAEAAVAQHLLSSDDVEHLSRADADALLPHGSVMFGTNARSRTRRAGKLLGWKPVQSSLEEDIGRNVALEAERLGRV